MPIYFVAKGSAIETALVMEEQPSKDLEGTLSKNARKRLLKKKKQEESKSEWRKKNREKRKNSIRRKKELGLEVPKRFKPDSTIIKSGEICFDFNYNGLMNDKELSSLCAQIARCYSINRRSSMPFNLKLSFCGGEISKYFEDKFPDYVKWDMKVVQNGFADIDVSKCIYLSGDAEDILESIEDDKIYVIGGLVDRNRHKGASLERAVSNKIKAYRLPINENTSLKTSSILTIVHVFEILSKFKESKNWELAVNQAIPNRKKTI